LENGVITEVLEKKTSVDVAATEALKRHPDLLKSWLDGVSTANGANGLQAVQTALGVK
jgi:glycine betaine/proline transport system substrate-binding protein